eukprot:4407014-Prymnesium_polylepis.1
MSLAGLDCAPPRPPWLRGRRVATQPHYSGPRAPHDALGMYACTSQRLALPVRGKSAAPHATCHGVLHAGASPNRTHQAAKKTFRRRRRPVQRRLEGVLGFLAASHSVECTAQCICV